MITQSQFPISNHYSLLRQEGAKRTIPWFRDGVRCVKRHPLNQRKTGSVAKQYMSKILDSGLVQGVRGEAWFQADPDNEGHFLAISFGTLLLVKEVHGLDPGPYLISQLDRYCQWLMDQWIIAIISMVNGKW